VGRVLPDGHAQRRHAIIYVVEDDATIRELIVYSLNSQGLEAIGFEKPSAFWEACRSALPQLLLLDIMLPEQDGLQVLHALRSSAATRRLPVIMLTAKGSEFDKVVGLDAGADDYIPKPFGMMELIARVKALLRRTAGSTAIHEYRLGTLYVCPERHVVKVEEEEITLTLKEFELLCLLMDNEDRVFTRSQLLNCVWGYRYTVETRTVDMHVKTLRQKLGPVAGAYVQTVRGVGYKVSAKE
jgi:two-component system, OmpR family, alkaline phosphatase synthesis response regulator PhoP